MTKAGRFSQRHYTFNRIEWTSVVHFFEAKVNSNYPIYTTNVARRMMGDSYHTPVRITWGYIGAPIETVMWP